MMCITTLLCMLHVKSMSCFVSPHKNQTYNDCYIHVYSDTIKKIYNVRQSIYKHQHTTASFMSRRQFYIDLLDLIHHFPVLLSRVRSGGRSDVDGLFYTYLQTKNILFSSQFYGDLVDDPPRRLCIVGEACARMIDAYKCLLPMKIQHFEDDDIMHICRMLVHVADHLTLHVRDATRTLIQGTQDIRGQFWIAHGLNERRTELLRLSIHEYDRYTPTQSGKRKRDDNYPRIFALNLLDMCTDCNKRLCLFFEHNLMHHTTNVTEAATAMLCHF